MCPSPSLGAGARTSLCASLLEGAHAIHAAKPAAPFGAAVVRLDDQSGNNDSAYDNRTGAPVWFVTMSGRHCGQPLSAALTKTAAGARNARLAPFVAPGDEAPTPRRRAPGALAAS